MTNKSSQGDILHFAAARLRVTGSGTLKLSLHSLDDIKVVTMSSVIMASATNIEPLKLTNYTNQRGQLVGTTTGINEVFNISKIVIFVKTLYSGYPQ